MEDKKLEAQVVLGAGFLDPGDLDETQPSSPSEPTPLPERIGPYRVERELARGGMGVVYLAHHEQLDRPVALKRLLGGAFSTSEERERFTLETQAVARLRHPSIVGIHEVGEAEGQPYYAMDFIKGQNLAQRLETSSIEDEREAAQLTLAVAEALAYAHERSILHRDVKPSNVILGDEGPVLTDFGLAADIQRSARITVTGQVLGSPPYMPPEQATGDHGRVDVRSDVYALGATLYHMLCGRPPFEGDSALHVLQRVVAATPKAPSALRATLSPDLETICLTCLAKEPAQRYESARALADDLQRFLGGRPIQARRASLARRGAAWARRNRTLVGAVASLLGVGLVVGTISLVLFVQRLESERTLAEQARARAVSERLSADAARDDAQSATAQAVADRKLAQKEQARAETERTRAEQERERAQSEKEKASQERLRAEEGRDVAKAALESLLAAVRQKVRTGLGPGEARAARRALLTEAREGLARLLEVDTPRGARNRVAVHRQLGQLAEEIGDMQAAHVSYSAGLVAARSWAEREPEGNVPRRLFAQSLVSLARVEVIRKADAAARPLLEEALQATREDRFLRSSALSLLGTLHQRSGEHDKARERFREALRLMRGVMTKDPAARSVVARKGSFFLCQLGQLHLERDELPQAEATARLARRGAERALAATPDKVWAHRQLGIAWALSAKIARKRGDPVEAARALANARRALERVYALDPEVALPRADLGRVLEAQGEVARERGQLVASDRAFTRALKLARQGAAGPVLGRLMVRSGEAAEAVGERARAQLSYFEALHLVGEAGGPEAVAALRGLAATGPDEMAWGASSRALKLLPPGWADDDAWRPLGESLAMQLGRDAASRLAAPDRLPAAEAALELHRQLQLHKPAASRLAVVEALLLVAEERLAGGFALRALEAARGASDQLRHVPRDEALASIRRRLVAVLIQVGARCPKREDAIDANRLAITHVLRLLSDKQEDSRLRRWELQAFSSYARLRTEEDPRLGVRAYRWLLRRTWIQGRPDHLRSGARAAVAAARLDARLSKALRLQAVTWLTEEDRLRRADPSLFGPARATYARARLASDPHLADLRRLPAFVELARLR